MKFNKNEFGWKEKVNINTNLNNDTFNIKFLPDMNTNSNMYIVNIIDLEEKTTYRVNTNINKNVLVLRYIFSDGTLKNLYSLNGKYILGKVEIYIYRKTDTLIEFDVNNIRHTCNIDEVNKTVEITKKALILNTDNAQEYTPTKDYHPATKKYVDSKFVMYESIETIYTIPMSEMQKCNNGTGRYVSSIDFDELFINHEKYIYYANYKDDTLIPVKYDSKYNRFITDVLDKTSDYNIILGFDLGTHRMYPFSSGLAVVKAYTFTNDLVIKRVPILDVNEVATKKYVDDKAIVEQIPILRVNEDNKIIYVNCNEMGTYKKYFVPNKYTNVYSFSFVYTNDDNTETEIVRIGGALTKDDFVLCSRNTSSQLILVLGNTDKYTYTKSTKTIERGLYGYLKIGNTAEFTPTSDYHPATKKYVDDAIANQPQISFNESGELVVTINGVSKTFVPKQ